MPCRRRRTLRLRQPRLIGQRSSSRAGWTRRSFNRSHPSGRHHTKRLYVRRGKGHTQITRIQRSTSKPVRSREGLFTLRSSTCGISHPMCRLPLHVFDNAPCSFLLLAIFITVMVGSALIALRNVKLGRGDRRGAFRLAGVLLVLFFLRWLFSSHHVATETEVFNFIFGVQTTLYWTFFFWVVYLAF